MAEHLGSIFGTEKDRVNCFDSSSFSPFLLRLCLALKTAQDKELDRQFSEPSSIALIPGYVLMPDVMETMDRYNNELAESRMEKAKKLCKEVHNLDVKVETRIESGDPRDVICQAAEKLSADVVVLGSHGYGLIKRAFLGSVSNYCAQKAKCPVLIAKRPESTPPSKY